ncbi:hypothetical protein FACS189443_5840 [Planctomycetales bacterium]|nr:hypothetical protein FACS189443_5840 [Planctomycetales bacterium]
MDTKTKYALFEERGQDAGKPPVRKLVRHDYFETYLKRLEKLNRSTSPQERQLGEQLTAAIAPMLDTNTETARNELLPQQSTNFPVSLAMALTKVHQREYGNALRILDSMNLTTASDNKTREEIAAALVKRLDNKASTEQKQRGKDAAQKLLNYRLSDRETLNLIPNLLYFGLNAEAVAALDRLITISGDAKLQSEILYSIDKLGGNVKDNAAKIAGKILNNPMFLKDGRHLTADSYLLDKAITSLDMRDESTARLLAALESRMKANLDGTDSKILLAKMCIASDQPERAKTLVLELAQEPSKEHERRQMITGLLLHFGLQKELDAMNQRLTILFNKP